MFDVSPKAKNMKIPFPQNNILLMHGIFQWFLLSISDFEHLEKLSQSSHWLRETAVHYTKSHPGNPTLQRPIAHTSGREEAETTKFQIKH